jgi:DUF4097 and DUF4098 domain-containing protein YvlB
MPAFDTPEPISATIDVVLGDVRVVASDRADTVVEVLPTDPSRKADVTAAEVTRVEFGNGKLLVKTSKRWRHFGLTSDGGSVDVMIELPTGSHVHSDTSMGDFRGEGQLGDCRIRTSMGSIRLDSVGALNLGTASGAVIVDQVAGPVEANTGAGEVRIGQIAGTGLIKNSNGDTKIAEISQNLRVKAANGDIAVERAHGSVDTRTANGDIRIGEVVRGKVVLESATGELEVGIREGTAAYLDLNAMTGRVHNELDSADAPGEAEASVEVRARTVSGDIVVRRSLLTADD